MKRKRYLIYNFIAFHFNLLTSLFVLHLFFFGGLFESETCLRPYIVKKNSSLHRSTFINYCSFSLKMNLNVFLTQLKSNTWLCPLFPSCFQTFQSLILVYIMDYFGRFIFRFSLDQSTISLQLSLIQHKNGIITCLNRCNATVGCSATVSCILCFHRLAPHNKTILLLEIA